MIQRIAISRDPFAAADPAATLWPRRGIWPAKWIAPAGGEGPRFTMFFCRCRLEESCRIRFHLVADAVYRLWIDGAFAGRGPEQGDRCHTYFDSYSWEAAAGEHTLAVLVADYGDIGPYSRMGFRRDAAGGRNVCGTVEYGHCPVAGGGGSGVPF